MSSIVNIEGIDKVELLKALWENSKPSLYFEVSNINSPNFDYDKAKEAVLEKINYFMGRCIKCDLSKNEVYPYLYDRDYGKGKFQEIVNSLK